MQFPRRVARINRPWPCMLLLSGALSLLMRLCLQKAGAPETLLLFPQNPHWVGLVRMNSGVHVA